METARTAIRAGEIIANAFAHTPCCASEALCQMSIFIGLDPNGKVMMTRDMELIRKILLAIKAKKDVVPRIMELDGVDQTVLGRHLEMLVDVGLIEGMVFESGDYSVSVQVKDMSWEGHDFLAVLENDTVWSKLKQKFPPTELAGLPLTIIKDAGLALLADWAKRKIGL